jgi:hypothetical protein
LKLSERELSGKRAKEFHQLVICLMLGEMFGIKSLHQLLASYGISSSRPHQIWKRVSTSELVSMMNQWLWRLFTPEFQRMIDRSGSTHSRENLTLVIDASIFRQWLPQEQLGQYFAKYFSGQINGPTYGLSLMLCGMSIGEVFYPLHFQMRRKDHKEIDVAERILTQIHNKLCRIAQPDAWPPLYLSVDSGFRSSDFIQRCEGLNIHYIGVPEKSHVLWLQDEKLKVRDLVDRFKAKEAQALATASPDDPPFTWRVRVGYQCIGQEVVMLLFRLNGSRKVSAIFSPSLEIKAKTLRRHWFARTKIEQLFRTIKHDLQIQRATTTNRLDFLKQFVFCLCKALHAQLWIQQLKKAHPAIKRIGYLGAQHLISFHQIQRQELDQRLADLCQRPFAT